MNTKHRITTVLALVAMILIASQVSARMFGQPYGQMMRGAGMGYGYGPALTESQQDEVKKIEQEYQSDLVEKETAVRNKVAELEAARTKDSTTFGEIKNLRNELYGLEQEYWLLRNEADRKISQTVGTTYYGNMGPGSDYCAWHDNHSGMSGATSQMYSRRGPMMGYGQGPMMGNGQGSMMGYGQGGCRW